MKSVFYLDELVLGDIEYRYRYVAPNIDIEYRNVDIDIENDIISAFFVSTGELPAEKILQREGFRKWSRRRIVYSIHWLIYADTQHAQLYPEFHTACSQTMFSEGTQMLLRSSDRLG